MSEPAGITPADNPCGRLALLQNINSISEKMMRLLQHELQHVDRAQQLQQQQAITQQQGAALPAGDGPLQELFDVVHAQIDAGREGGKPLSLPQGVPGLELPPGIAGSSAADMEALIAAEGLAQAQLVAQQLSPARRPPGEVEVQEIIWID
jgi:hypothetical protein